MYDVLREGGTSLGVVRVAAPAFPKDKLESEVGGWVHDRRISADAFVF